MPEVLIYVVFALLVVALVVLFVLSAKQGRMIRSLKEDNKGFMKDLSQNLKEYHKENKDDYERAQTSQREEISERIKDFNSNFSEKVALLSDTQKKGLENMTESQRLQLDKMQSMQEQRLKSLEDSQKLKLEQIEKTQAGMIQSTEKSLENMRQTVEEKLEKTLNDRISKSFETVGNQLDNVKNGLAEMRDLAKDVGGLKKVLSNVKMRGGLGEVQLQMLLEQYLAPGQYVANAHTGADKNSVVEFAVRFPGQDGNPVLLPIDSKFPKDRYDALLEAYESADKDAMDAARRDFCSAIKNEARNINKYINVPETTPFAIMFLPFEGLYAEVMSNKNGLAEALQAQGIMVSGPSTITALLNSLAMGFKSIAINKKASEVYDVLGAAKAQYEKFGTLLETARKRIELAGKAIDDAETKNNFIQRKLKTVETLDEASSNDVLGIE